jgi:diaminohydroxyphosphoribosylaminopyrimidine deaminase/5-amino-6-(5-phosphoribosylamino)uracil reductase
MDDARHMRRALQLAARGRGRVSPNPMVGAVLVDAQERVVGEGYHRQVGGPHAEAEALAAAGNRARGATLYCTLEPCTVDGRTPPCVDAVIAAGIARLVCALEDPDERVAGRGFARLRQAGLAVDVGEGEAAARELIGPYLHHRRTGRAWVSLKLGMSLDGRIATRDGESRWITGEPARRHAHRWRSWVDGILVGAGTVIADDPALTVRHVRGRDPRPVVVDGRLRSDAGARVYGGRDPVLATAASSDPAARQTYADRGVEVWDLPDEEGVIDMRHLAARCGAAGMTHVILEGGRQLAAAALRDGAVDEVMLYLAPRLLGADAIAGVGELGLERLQETPWLRQVRTRRLGDDLLITGRVDCDTNGGDTREEATCSPD